VLLENAFEAVHRRCLPGDAGPPRGDPAAPWGRRAGSAPAGVERRGGAAEAAECEPGSDGLVLRNLLGIKDPAVMEAVERDLLLDLYQAIMGNGTPIPRLRMKDLIGWHRQWLGSVYAWAGKVRPFNPESMDELISGFAQVHVEFVLIHPFHEGNGRIARLLIDVRACQAGIGPLDYPAWDQQREQYVAAIRAGAMLDMAPMEAQFRQVLPGSTADP